MIMLDGLTKQQAVIAKMLWDVESWEETEEIVQRFGREADVIRRLIALACIDEETVRTDQCGDALELIERIKGR